MRKMLQGRREIKSGQSLMAKSMEYDCGRMIAMFMTELKFVDVFFDASLGPYSRLIGQFKI